MRRADKQPPWVLVSGGFHREGGMDRANAALARYLCARDVPVHLVGYRFDPEFEAHPAVTIHRAAKPAGSFYLAQRQLNRLGRAVAREVTARSRGTRVVVNGGNCAWPGINWMHCVHHAWNPCDPGAPLWFRLKNRFEKARARRDERRCAAIAEHIIANSERTRRSIVERLGVAPERVTTVYLGSDSDWRTITPARRAAARAELGQTAGRPLVAFVGALGYDANKGFDTLWRAWRWLCARPEWDANLIAVGGGRAVPGWRVAIARAGLDRRAEMLGFSGRVDEILAASDLLVSPVRYESYGLNAHEAICRGVPAIVSESAGIAERFSGGARELLLRDAEDADELADRMLRWRADPEGFRRRIEPLARTLRAHAWDDMAAEIVALAGAAASRDRTGIDADGRRGWAFRAARNRENTFAD